MEKIVWGIIHSHVITFINNISKSKHNYRKIYGRSLVNAHIGVKSYENHMYFAAYDQHIFSYDLPHMILI